MKKLWLFASVLCLAGCSTQTESTPQVAQAPRPTSASVAIVTPTTVVQAPLPTSSPTATPKTFVAKGYEKAQEVVLRELEKLQNSTPEQDLQIAWQNKDFRFVAVRTVATQVFGVSGDISNPMVEKYGMKAVEGTGDVVFSPEQAKLQKLATKYSIRYNQLLMKKLSESQPSIVPRSHP